MQFGANDSNRGEIVASFRAACEPMRAVLLEYPFLSGTKEPNYSDIFVFSFFLVRYPSVHCTLLNTHTVPLPIPCVSSYDSLANASCARPPSPGMRHM